MIKDITNLDAIVHTNPEPRICFLKCHGRYKGVPRLTESLKIISWKNWNYSLGLFKLFKNNTIRIYWERKKNPQNQNELENLWIYGTGQHV